MELQGVKLQAHTTDRKEFGADQAVFGIRPDTSDIKAINEVFKKNAYQRQSAGFLVEPGDRWLDMGANIGAFSVFAFKKGCAFKSFEAEPFNAQLTRFNIKRNGFAPDVANAAVVSDTRPDETLRFFVNSAPLGLRRHSLYLKGKTRSMKGKRAITVKAKRFSAVLLETGFDCVKLNVEGAEIAILGDLVDHSPLRKLVLEWSFDFAPRMAALRAALDKLEANFTKVVLSKNNLPWEQETYPYFPPNVYIYCMR